MSRLLHMISAVVALQAMALPAYADETPDLEELLSEKVVGGASKTLESAHDAPATVVTLTADDMHRYGIRSLNEAINYLAMGLITQDPLHSVEVGGRGVLITSDYGNHVLVVVDGHSLNEKWGGAAYYEQGLGIPLEMIDHVELILGPGSVLYGGTAMLAVINVVTKTARSNKGLHLLSECGVSPAQSRGQIGELSPQDGYACRLGAGVGFATSLLEVPFEVNAYVEGYFQNGPSFTWGPQSVENEDGEPAALGSKAVPGVWEGTTHDQYYTIVPTAHARVTYGDFALSLHLESYKRATPAPAFNQALTNFDDPNSYELDRWFWADLKYTRTIGDHFQMMARLYGDLYDYQQFVRIDEASFCSDQIIGTCRTHLVGEARWAGLELQGVEDWLGDDTLTTMLGAEVRLRWIGARLQDIDEGTEEIVDDSRDTALDVPFAVYLQQRWTPFNRVQLNAGARFDRDPRGGDHISPRAAVVVESGDGGTFKTVYSEAFRSPTYYEYYYAAVDQEPNPDLRSETVRSLEASIEQRLGRHRLLLGVFRSWWKDMVELRLISQGDEVYQYQNASTIDNYGFNAAVEGSVDAFSYGLSFTAAHTRRTTPDGETPLTVAPQVFGNARVAYDLPGLLPELALAAWVVGPRLADRALDGDFPIAPEAPSDLEARLTISGEVPLVDGLSYRLSGSFASAKVNPYVVGPNQSVGSEGEPAELSPINRLTFFLTLQYHLFQ